MENILTNMCLLKNTKDNTYLFLNRVKQDWPGLTLPGGHVEPDETYDESVIREMKEETGLDIKNVECIGKIEWLIDGKRHLSLLYFSDSYEGELLSSVEGKVFFEKLENISKYPFSTDFDKVLEIYNKRGLLN